MKKFISIALGALLALATFTACGGGTSSTPPASTPAGSEAGTPVPESAGGSTGDYEKPKFMAIGTAATGAVFYPIGIGMADILTNQLGIQTTAQVTGGAIENISLVQEGTVDLGITMGNAAQAAYEGAEGYDMAHTNLAGMFSGLSKGYFQVVVLDDSPIQTMEDLVGKRVAMGPAGNGAITVAQTVWAEYGFGLDDISDTYIAYSDAISSLTDGNCDAVVVQTAVPNASIQELAASGKSFRLIPVGEDVAASLMEKYTYFGYDDISASVYDIAQDTPAMYITNMVIIRADLDENLVYDMTKAIFENLDVVKDSHPAASGLSLENAARSPIPLHPGALRYFEEMGAA